jgi:two-component system, OmpR family, response regulator RpaA
MKTLRTVTVVVKPSLTVGQLARLTGAAPRTVSKWFDAGLVKGYVLPGCQDRRIPLPNAIQFMRDRGMPIPAELLPALSLAFGLQPGELPDLVHCDPFDLGALVATQHVATAVVGDGHGLAAAKRACELVRASNPTAKVALVVGEDVTDAGAGAWDTVYTRPVDWAAVEANL